MSWTRFAGPGIDARQCLAAAIRSPRASQMNRCEAETTVNIHRFRTRVPVSGRDPPPKNVTHGAQRRRENRTRENLSGGSATGHGPAEPVSLEALFRFGAPPDLVPSIICSSNGSRCGR